MTNYLKLVSIEIGNVADNVVSATFSNQIVSFDFSAGITIKVNGSIVQILSVKRLNDQKTFQYTISQSVISTDTIAFSYLALPSNLVGIDKSNKYGDYVSSEFGVVSLEDIGLLTVINNVSSSTPVFVSAEIGTINGSTVVVTFDAECVTPPDVTIKENGVTTTHDGGTIQGDPTIVYYVIPIPWHGSDSIITVDDNAVSNNIEFTTIFEVQADVLSNGALSSLSDLTDYNHDFTQSDSDAQPTVGVVGGYKTISFADGSGDYLNGQNWADLDNLSEFMVMDVHQFTYQEGHFFSRIISKYDDNVGTGWDVEIDYYFSAWTDYSNYIEILQGFGNAPFDYNAKHVNTYKHNSMSSLELFVDGVSRGNQNIVGSPLSFAVSETVKIGNYFADPLNVAYDISAILVFNPMPTTTNQAALETRLGARYGVTL